MVRWTALIPALALLLGGCVTTREVVYRDAPYRGATETRYYDGGRYYERDDRYYGSSSAYRATSSYGGGDYYYGYESPAWYWDYPAYYSIFWPMYRSWYDPYWYPNYYYGVTYYPRNYFSISFGSGGYGWPRYSHLYYSPYRYSWVDNYYDWTPWYGYHRYDRDRRPTPRFGSARNEAERLSRRSDWYDTPVRARSGHAGNGNVRDTAYGRYGTARGGARDADYGSRTAPRQDPGFRGFGVTDAGGEVRRTGYGGTRQDPGIRGFSSPESVRRDEGVRNVDYGAYRSGTQRGHDAGPSRTIDSAAQREAGRRGGVYYAPSMPVTRGYDAGSARDYQRSAPVARDYTGAAMRPRGYDAEPAYPRSSIDARSYTPAPRGYDAGAAPAPQYSAPPARAAPAYSATEPRYESRPEPRFEGRSSERSSSGGGRGGDVRRVGSTRND